MLYGNRRDGTYHGCLVTYDVMDARREVVKTMRLSSMDIVAAVLIREIACLCCVRSSCIARSICMDCVMTTST
ncbi:hypothetical protein O3G_MSEX013463 [Manduca sexta]|uniref:Uncharacterized protein n=1 Tax=Manduca sexta TaxID=7130 RepID=A0A922CY19_MANSE|nr:hypothetical protein O3G_MSEX013463 [Manduca sexta]